MLISDDVMADHIKDLIKLVRKHRAENLWDARKYRTKPEEVTPYSAAMGAYHRGRADAERVNLWQLGCLLEFMEVSNGN